MTISSPAPARRGARAWRGALAVLVTLAAALAPVPAWAAAGTGPTAASATATPTPTPIPAPTPALSIAASGWGVLVGAQPFTLSARIVASPAKDVTFTGSTVPLETADAVASWLDGTDTTTATPLAIASISTPGVPSSATPPSTPTATPTGPAPEAPEEHTGAVTVDPVATGLDQLAPGVYPLAATAGSLTARSVLVVAGAARGGVATVVPITAPPLASALLSADALATLTAPGGSLRAQLDAVAGTPATLAIDPAIVAAIRLLGSRAPASATAWLGDLLALPNARFALQFGDADLAAQVAADITVPLSPTTLVPLVSEPDDDAVLTLDALLDIGATTAHVLWPATGSADTTTLNALASPDASTLVAAPDGPVLTVDGATALAYDPLLAAALRDVAAATAGVDRAAAHAAASAYATFADPDRPLIAVVDRDAARDALGIREAVAHATALSGRTTMSLAAVAASTPIDGGLPEINRDAEAARTAAVEQLRADEDRLTAFATILEDPAVITARERASVLQLIGNGWRGDDTWPAAIEQHREATETTIDSVHLVPSSDIVLLGANTSLVFSVRNDLRWPVSLVLTATPSDPRLVVQTTTPVTAGAAQNTRVEIPVEARVASGEVVLALTLASTSMMPVGPSESVRVSVRAEWEGIGAAVLGVGVAALLVMGAVRTIKRFRDRNKMDAVGQDPEDG